MILAKEENLALSFA